MKIIISVLLVLVAVLPLGLYWGQVEFEPARFVEEWVKLWAQGTILLVAAWKISEGLGEMKINRSSKELIEVMLRADLELAIRAAEGGDYKKFSKKSATALDMLKKVENVGHSREWTVMLLRLRQVLEAERLQHLMKMEANLTRDEKEEIQREVKFARCEIESFLRAL